MEVKVSVYEYQIEVELESSAGELLFVRGVVLMVSGIKLLLLALL